MTAAPRRIVSYPPRSQLVAKLGYNMAGNIDNAHVDLAQAGGASILRVQFSWDAVESYSTPGTYSLTTAWQNFLSYCGTKGVKPLVVAAYSGPRTGDNGVAALGNLTIGGASTIPAGTPAGTSIPVQTYGFTIDYPHCFIGGVSSPTNRGSYYGSLITSATASAIILAAATNVDLHPGDVFPVARLLYPPPSSDADPSNTAYVNYVLFLAQQIASLAGGGYVDIWNEYVWAHDPWDTLAHFYDSPPVGITTSSDMKAILTALQAASLPTGVQLVNGVSDKTAAGAVPVAGTNFSHNSWHPYGNNPEQQHWSYYGWGNALGQFSNPSGIPAGATWDAAHAGSGWDQWEPLIPADIGGNLKGLGFLSDLKPGGPWPGHMITESGLDTTNDLVQARWNARCVLCTWGCGGPCVIYAFDDGAASGSLTYSVAPQSIIRQSYTANQRIMQVLSRMGATAFAGPLPHITGWPSDDVPLMAVTVLGGTPGNCVIFVWQRTWVNDSTPWTSLGSPAAQLASIYVPAGLAIKECFDVITGSVVSISGPTNNVASVSVADNPVAIRFGP